MNAWRNPLALALFALTCACASAAETIRDYQSRIEVNVDGSLFVTETIVVTAENNQIKHGIYRDFPNLYVDRNGFRRATGFTVAEIQRDGHAEPWHSEGRSNGIRVYIGSADTFVPPGQHSYVIKYKTDRQLGFFPDHDELYWNVTGTGWVFPIEKVSAEVILPTAAKVSRIEAYTGPQGSRGADYVGTIDPNRTNTASFATTKPLRNYSGLTIVVGWPPGFVARPTVLQKAIDFFSLNAGTIVGFLALFATLGYYLWAWNKVGRDPRGGTIIPLYGPPEGFSPAAVRYVHRMGYDQRCFAANLINLAVKGYLRIDDTGVRVRARQLVGKAPLTADESEMYEKLFRKGTHFDFTKDSYPDYSVVTEKLRRSLTNTYKDPYFSRHTGYWLIGLIPAFVSGLTTFAGMTGPASLLGMLFVEVSLATMLVVFLKLLRAPTVLGRKTLDQIEGFKRYLTIAEKDRLNLENPPKLTPQHFDQFLPYALALGVEQQWSEQCAEALRAAETDPNSHYTPIWYSGNQFSPSNIGGFGTAIASSVGGAIAAAATPPSDSSGFSGGGGGGGGGGGSSGGGGGGGGGGGW